VLIGTSPVQSLRSTFILLQSQNGFICFISQTESDTSQIESNASGQCNMAISIECQHSKNELISTTELCQAQDKQGMNPADYWSSELCLLIQEDPAGKLFRHGDSSSIGRRRLIVLIIYTPDQPSWRLPLASTGLPLASTWRSNPEPTDISRADKNLSRLNTAVSGGPSLLLGLLSGSHLARIWPSSGLHLGPPVMLQYALWSGYRHPWLSSDNRGIILSRQLLQTG
jgi:hypothetical protein